ncbi:hypothetical protein BG005_011188 [Podila minutissima]|nr:hypothetical protein BG005_011188 [Podila minutissima]
MANVIHVVEANDVGTAIVSSTTPSLSSLHESSGAGDTGATTTAAVETHPLDDNSKFNPSGPPPTCPCNDATNTHTSNTINPNSTASSMASPPYTHPREPRSAASTPSNLSFREGFTNHNNNTNTTNVIIGHESSQLPPSPMARPRSVQPSEHLPHMHLLAERRPRPTESISSMSHSSRARVRPLSVTIDLSSVDPPAYEQNSSSTQQPQHWDQWSHSQNQRTSMTAPSLRSMAMSVQEQNYRPPSVLSANPSIAVGSSQAVVSPLHSTAGTEAVSVIVSPSMSAPRRPFLEEDELPEYITLSENGPPFKIPASESITYTVTPSQGPEEFQPQLQDEIIIHQPASRRRNTTGSTQEHTSLSFSGTFDHGQGNDQPETTLHTRRGAWTLEYWVNDTIMYLCYLMDPKHSTTSALVPRGLVPDTNTVPDQPRGEPDVQITTAAPAPVNQGSGSGDMFNAFLAPEESTPEEEEVANENEQETMERVPTGHLRGGPPPLTRPRIQQPYHNFVSNDLSRTVDATYRVGGSGALTTAIIARPRQFQNAESLDVSSSTPVSGSVVAPVEEGPSDTTTETTGNMGTNQEEIASEEPSQEPSGGEPTGTLEVALNPVVSDQISVIDNPTNEDTSTQPPQSPRQPTLPLPPIRSLPESDQAANDVPPVPEHNFFNNALTAEFFKNPTYALVSAEDPQTWIWWSTHHEHNLQRCRQEGPNEEVLMWWRTRVDYNTKEAKEKRRRLRQWQKWQAREMEFAQQQRRELRRARQRRLEGEGSRRARGNRSQSQSQIQNDCQINSTTPTTLTSTPRKSDKKKKNKDKPKGTLLQRFFDYIESKYPGMPHNDTMEITMRVRGLYYAWREDDCGTLPPSSAPTTSGYGTHSNAHESRHRHRHHHRRQDSHQYYQEDLHDTAHPSDGPLPPSSTPPPPLTPLSPSPTPPPPPRPTQHPTHTSSSLPLPHHLKSRPRMFTLVRDDCLVMGQRVKGGPVAEIWIGDDDPSVPLHEYFASTSATYYPSISEVPVSSSHHHGIEGLVMPSSASTSGGDPGSTSAPYYTYPSGGGGGVTSDGASSITSNNGNTFMTEVSVATGGPMRSSTIASTFMAPVPSGRSFASSVARYNVSMGSPAPASIASLSDEDDDDEEEEEEEEDRPEGEEEEEEDELEVYDDQPYGPGGHTHAAPSSSFPPSLLRRKCVIRVLRGLNPEVETFALSTGPRLPELFELYTDQSMPGPSRGTFICSIVTFAVLFSAAFIGLAVSKN